ncbi:uncharacterized 14.8 kDa protein in frd-Gp32 intergenic region [Yersinia phage phiR1-RT]|uniref:Uncharacterized 14.8 kDa protein in frd-Gp32 intergenic region n=1 Tax=Yersinia phage phiR1-RT TaxID=1206558 RepID=I7J408_BPPR1|nr:hypothetical protein BN80_243 [Yersinia phage phiR1-RT]CCI88813.1 uncharacterized 14.8 kDa protein in frd-Gp32 intergenic region [Yersinia phage phiR1-RT]
MQEGKFYSFNEAFRADFIEDNSTNENMLRLIEEGGGSFWVLEMATEDTGKYVRRVRMKNGEVYDTDSPGDEYFELSNWEFKYFVEVVGLTTEGAQSMSLVVTRENAEEMIELIKKAFNK